MSMETTRGTEARDIREIAPSGAGDDRFLTADWSGQVSYWRGLAPEPASTFTTTWSFGGRRLALGGDADEPVAVTAAWERHGVCAYNARTGALIWQRKDVKRVQDLAVPPGLGVVTACSDDGPMQVLELSDGSTLARVRAVRACWGGPDTPLVGDVLDAVVFIDASTWTVLDRRRTGGWGKTAAAVSPTEALIATLQDQDGTSASVLQCLTRRGRSVWQWNGPQDAICQDLSWDAASDSWLGLLRDAEMTVQDRLVRWSTAGEMTTVAEIGSTQATAFLAGARLLSSDGSVIDTASGTRTASLW